MLASGLQSSHYLLTELSRSSIASSVNSPGPLSNALNELFTSITSGDLTDAKNALSKVEKVSTASLSASTPLGRFLGRVSTLLQQDDISAAQSALEDYQDSSSTSSSTQSQALLSSDTTASSASVLAQQVISLSDAISSNNIDQAASACDQLIQSVSDTSDPSSSVTSVNSDGSAESEDLTLQLQHLHSALNAGNMDTAQMALDGFLTSLSAGSLFDARA